MRSDSGRFRRSLGALVFLMAADCLALPLARSPGWTTLILLSLHVLAGVGLLVVLALWGAWGWHKERLRATPRLLVAASALTLGSGVLGAALFATAAFGRGRVVLAAHVATAGLAALAALAFAWRRRSWPRRKVLAAALALIALAAVAAVPEMAERLRAAQADPKQFFPSRAVTADGQPISAGEIASSQYCGECHREIFDQWRSSQHHLASFGNIFYRRAALYTIERKGAVAFRFCAGCHDPALLFSGQAEDPRRIDLQAPSALEGLACVGCHAIRSVSHSGTGSYAIDRPGQFPFANHPNAPLRAVNKLLIRLKPDVHRNAFLKPFHSRAEFCAACHKVSIEAAVNEFRWVRGFSEYDDWQRSGYSGHSATPFYSAAEPKRCQDCHMPAVRANDAVEAGRGFVHDHRFLGSNTTVPLARGDPEQFERVRRFLTEALVTVDIFAIAEVERFASTEASVAAHAWMPVDRTQPALTPAQVVTVDVVVRNRNVGHRFPAGTLDLWDAWLEFAATDPTGRTIFSSGHLTERGEVEPEAHFFRNRPLDRHGRRTDKSNRFDTVTILYDTSIPPGQSDVVHYQFRIPRDARGPLALRARVNYRKYTPYFARWVFGGRPAPGQEGRVSSKVDDRDWIIDDTPLPRLPVVTLAGDIQVAALSGSGRGLHPPAPAGGEDALRFNDYGIGLFGQGDYRGAEMAFRRVVELDPGYADGHVNMARVLLATSRTDEADAAVRRALALRHDYPKAVFFRGDVALIRGDYGQALADFERVLELYPDDRVVQQRAGRAAFLARRYVEATSHFNKVLEIDPEELGAYYNLMLCYQALGRSHEAEESRKRYEEYRPDFSIKQISAEYRTRHKADSIEAEPVHVHGSVEEP